MEIRKIEPRDFVKVAQLENENWILASTPHVMDSSAEKIIGKIMTGTTYFLAVENDEILGILDYGPRHKSEFGRHTVTFGIMTAQEARGKGVATTLINFFIDFAKKEGFKKITIQVMGSNPAALKLYKNSCHPRGSAFLSADHLPQPRHNYRDSLIFLHWSWSALSGCQLEL